MTALSRLVLCAIALAFAGSPCAAVAGDPVIVFAAASLKNALDEAADLFKARTGTELKISYGGSLALARQLENGAPAEIFASADEESMDYAAGKKTIRPDSRFDFLGNRLVVIAEKSSALTGLAFTPEAFARAMGAGRIATGETTSVPAGKYAKAALEKLGLWPLVETRLAMSDNVRNAMTFVSRGEAALGIVYASDAAADPAVRVVAVFPEESHPPIVYPFALTAIAKNSAAAEFLLFLRSAEARRAFEKQGFSTL